MKPLLLNQPRFSHGFTLLELLVSMALLSLVMAGMLSVISSMAQAQDRVEQRLNATDELRVTAAFVEKALGRISTRRAARALAPDASPYQFIARPQELIWVGVMPARFGAGGRSYFRLALEGRANGPALVLRFAPWSGVGGEPDWGSAESFEVAHAVTSFAMAYEDAWQSAPQWVGTWHRQDSVPARVRIELNTQSGDWPVWIVPLRQLPASQIGANRFTLGGRD
jgi:general secretion pathway protein J